MSEMPRVCSAVDRKARKVHSCQGCRKEINKGEVYRHTSGIWDEPESFRHCMNCANVIDNYKLFDPSLMPEDGPCLNRGGIKDWIDGFICQSWNGYEAAKDLADAFSLPQEYFARVMGIDEPR